MNKAQILQLLEQISSYIIVATLLIVPILFVPVMTEWLELPKQVFVMLVTLVLLVLFAVRSVVEQKVTFRRTPLDFGLVVLFLVVIASMFFSASQATAIIAGMPFLALILFYFLVVNTITDKAKERLVVSAVLISGVILSIFVVLHFFKVYILPYDLAKTPGFSLGGSLLATTIFLVALVPMGLAYGRSYFKKQDGGSDNDIWAGFFLGTSVIIIIGVLLGLFQLVTTARPLLLSQETGLRTALQPLTNFQTALFGTGPGTYLFNFTRFKDAAMNATNLWNFRFVNSSSLFLETLSTLGVIGMLSFLFLIFRSVVHFFRNATRNMQTIGVILSLTILFVFAFFLPFPFLPFFFIFVLLAFYFVRLANDENRSVYDVSLSIVALRKGLLKLEPETSHHTHSGASDVLSYILLVIVIITTGFIGFQTYLFTTSDIIFQKALLAANSGQAQQTYELQNQAIETFPYRDVYHRIFSQTNLAIANTLAEQIRTAPAGTTITDADRQRIVDLVQQSINFGRNAVTVAPVNVLNWENLTGIYRSLIGFAQNADQFAVVSAQQARDLDPTNPLVRLNLGGIYFQLGQYDLAIQEFSQAANLKQDFANAYYNLGHAYEAKGDAASLQNALSFYQAVLRVTEPGSEDAKKMEAEIAALSSKIGGTTTAETVATPPVATEEQTPLEVDTPAAQLPEQDPPVEVEGPPVASPSSQGQ